MLPEGWKPYRLGELMSFRNGLNFKQADIGEEIKIVGVSDFQARSTLADTSELATISVSGKIRETDLLQDGDLLFVRSNGNKALIGRCLYFPSIQERLSFSGFTIRGRIDSTKILPEFSSYLVRADHVTAQFFQGGSGTNISNLSQEILSDVCVTIPKPPEQERISELLFTWDKAIRTIEKLLANSRRQKQALMRQLLTGKHRLPGFSGEWKQYRLGKLFKERVENARGDLPLLSITRDEGVIPRGDVGRKDTSNEDKSKYLRICSGDIGYNTMRMWQGVSALSAYEGIISPAYTVLIPQPQMDGCFSAYLFKFKPVVFLFYRYSQGLVSDTWNLKYPHFAEIKVFIPERKEQEAIAEVLAAADEEIAIRVKELKGLQEEKRALMQQLLTGKRRVRLPDREAMEA